MDAQKRQVLQMLAEGKINLECAEQLLDELDGVDLSRTPSSNYEGNMFNYLY